MTVQSVLRRPSRGRVRATLDVSAVLYSAVMLASLLPSARVPSLFQIPYYLAVPGYSLLRLSNQQIGHVDFVAVVVATSLALLVGITSLFQTFFPGGGVPQSLILPVVSLAASLLTLWTSSFRRPTT